MLSKRGRTIFFINMGGGVVGTLLTPQPTGERERRRRRREKVRLISGYQIEVSDSYVLESQN